MSSNREIFINSSVGGNRIAIVDNKELVELFIDTSDHRRMVGSIYKGRIQNVIPGMQASFVDIGYELNSFLPFSCVIITGNSPSNTSTEPSTSLFATILLSSMANSEQFEIHGMPLISPIIIPT